METECVICKDQCIIPAKQKTYDVCSCWTKNLVCLTCLYSFCYNGKNFKERCVLCNSTLPKKYRPSDYYDVQKSLLTGKVDCPRGCEWKGDHDQCQKHLRKDCPNAKNKRCKGCNLVFDNNGYIEHLSKASANSFCISL
jgi:hypothetical protein